MKRILVPLPEELHRLLKMKAAADSLTLKEAVINAIRVSVSEGSVKRK